MKIFLPNARAMLAALLFLTLTQALAQPAFPSRPIRVVVPITAGGAPALPEVRQVLERAGIPAVGGTPEDFGAAIRTEVRKMAALVKASGARVE